MLVSSVSITCVLLPCAIIFTLRDILICRMKGFTQALFFGILSNTLYDDEGFSFDRGISKVRVLQWSRVDKS